MESRMTWVTKWIPYVLLLLAGIWLWNSGKRAGVLQEQIKSVTARLDTLGKEIDTRTVAIRDLDSKVAVLEDSLSKQRVIVRFRDAAIKPVIDSVVADLLATVDVETKAKITTVVEGYEERLKIRDNLVESQEVFINVLQQSIAKRDSLIAVLAESNKLAVDSFTELAKQANPGLFKRIINALPEAILTAGIVIIIKR